MSEPEDAVLARRFFLGGCCGLPLLWATNALYFAPKIARGQVSPQAQRCACGDTRWHTVADCLQTMRTSLARSLTFLAD